MAQDNTLTTAAGWFKEVYGKSRDFQPDHKNVLDALPHKEELGKEYVEPIFLTAELGGTFGGSAGNSFTLNSPVAAESVDARLSGVEYVLPANVSLKTLKAAVGGGKKSFGPFAGKLIENLTTQVTKMAALMAINGGLPCGIVDTGGAASTGTTQTITLQASTLIRGAFLNSRGALLDIHSAGGTQRNSSATFTLSDYDMEAGTIEIVSTDATQLNNVTDGDYVTFVGQRGNDGAGVRFISNVSTSYLGISVASYPDFAGNSYSAGSAALTVAKLRAALSKAHVRGSACDMLCFISPEGWDDLANELEGQRQIVDYSEVKNAKGGVSSVTVNMRGGHMVEFIVTSLMPTSEAVLVPRDSSMRIGAYDIHIPVEANDLILPTANGMQIRCAYDGAVWCPETLKCVRITGIA